MIFHAARKLNNKGTPELDKDIYIEQGNVEENELMVPGLSRCCNPRFVSYTITAKQVTFSFEKIRPFPEERLQVELWTRYLIITENPIMGVTHTEILSNLGFITKTIPWLQSIFNQY